MGQLRVAGVVGREEENLGSAAGLSTRLSIVPHRSRGDSARKTE